MLANSVEVSCAIKEQVCMLNHSLEASFHEIRDLVHRSDYAKDKLEHLLQSIDALYEETEEVLEFMKAEEIQVSVNEHFEVIANKPDYLRVYNVDVGTLPYWLRQDAVHTVKHGPPKDATVVGVLRRGLGRYDKQYYLVFKSPRFDLIEAGEDIPVHEIVLENEYK